MHFIFKFWRNKIVKTDIKFLILVKRNVSADPKEIVLLMEFFLNLQFYSDFKRKVKIHRNSVPVQLYLC